MDPGPTTGEATLDLESREASREEVRQGLTDRGQDLGSARQVLVSREVVPT